MENKYEQCPNCKAEWTPEEKKEQECWTCGYPDHDDDETANQNEEKKGSFVKG